MHRHATRRAARGGKADPSLVGPLERSAGGGSSLGTGKQPDQGIRACLLQEGPAEGSFAHGAVITLMLIFFFFTSHQRCLQSEFYFFVIPLSLLKGECVFLWEE